MYASYKSSLGWYGFSLLLLIIYGLYSNAKGSLTYIQQQFMISSSILYPVIFWYLLGKLTGSSLLFEKTAVSLFLYVNWYYWTYAITNHINTMYGIINN
jgi:hypothetical protein